MDVLVSAHQRYRRDRPVPSLNRFRWFLLVSAALIAAVAVGVGLLVGHFFERHLYAYEEAQTAAIVQTQARQHLTRESFEAAGAASGRGTFEGFLGGLPGVFRMKVFDPAGRIVWSDEPRLIGQAFGDNRYLRRALDGHVMTVLEEPTRSEHVYERTRRYVAEAYVPITFPGGGRIAGVIETYKDMTAVMAHLHRTQARIWAMAGGMGLFLWVTLAAIVWTASRSEQRARERLAAILAGIADEMVIVDRGLRVVWMNAAAEAAAGGPAVGQPCFRVMGAPPEGCEQCPVMRTLESGRVERGVRAQTLPGGRTRHLDLVTAPLRDVSGQVHQVLEVARDITALVEMEERLKQSNEALLAAQAQLVEKERLAAVGEVVVGLHHAILNPLTGILGALQVLKADGLSGADRARALAEAEGEVRKVERLIRRLPDLRRAGGTRYVGETTMLDLEPLQ